MPPFRVLTVCTGNVCRSPAGALLLREGIRVAGLQDLVEVDSAGTSWETEGHPIDDRTALALERAGIAVQGDHAARVAHQGEMSSWDLILGMTLSHTQSMRRKIDQIPAGEKVPEVLLWGQFDPAAPVSAREEDLEIADPWYEGQKAFDRTVLIMERAVPSLVFFIRGRMRDAGIAR